MNSVKINFDDLDLDNASNKQKGNYGEHKADDNLINNQSLKDAGYDLKSLGREAPCKTAFEDSSNVSEITLDLASFAMGVYGVKQFVSSGANYLRMNKSYINANISEAAQNSKILKQAISNVSKNSKGITLGSNGGNAGKYVSDVKGEFDALKNIKNGTKVAGSAKAGGSGSIDDMVKACEGGAEANLGNLNGKTPATRVADKFRSLSASKRPNTVATIKTKDGKYIIGRNSGGVINGDVQNALDIVGINEFEGQCAEVNALARAMNKGIDLDGATISVSNVRGINSTNGVHGTFKKPCSTCEPLLEYFKILVNKGDK